MHLAAKAVVRQRRKFGQFGFHVDRGAVGFVQKENDDQQDHRGRYQEQPLGFHAKADVRFVEQAIHAPRRELLFVGLKGLAFVAHAAQGLALFPHGFRQNTVFQQNIAELQAFADIVE